MAPPDSNVLKLAPDANTPAYRSAPHNIEAEQSLLGAILVNNDAFYRVSDFLEPPHFFEPIHAKIFELTASLIRAGNASEARYVGNRPGTQIRWQKSRHLWFQGDYGIFYAGSFIKQTQPGRNLNYWALWTGYKF